MPKASVNKQRKARFWKGKIRKAKNWPMTPPSLYSGEPKDFQGFKFGAGVAARSNLRHDFRTPALVEIVQNDLKIVHFYC
jgi:hypothetical protein